MQERSNTKRHLPVKLTAEEYVVRSEDLARQCEEEDRLKVEAKSVAGEFAERIKGVHLDVKRLSQIVESHEEYRGVECFWRPNHTGNTWELFRADTGELVDSQTMSPEDKQESLGLS